MQKLLLGFLFLFLLTNFASAGNILSDRSVDHDLGNGKHEIQVFAAPQFRLDPDTNKWLPFTRSVNVFSNSSGLFINFSDQQRTRRLFNFARLPAACSDYSLQDNDHSYEFSATCNVPAGKGTFLKNFSGVIADRFIGGTAFEAKGIYIDFENWNINTGAFNSSIQFINYSNGKLGVNLSWSSNQSQTIELDPFISSNPANDVWLRDFSDLTTNGSIFLKFLTSVVPNGSTIADTEACLLLRFTNVGANRLTTTSVPMAIYNQSADWNASGNMTELNAFAKQYTGNWTNVTRTTVGSGSNLYENPPNYFCWNVTNSFAYAKAAGYNATYVIDQNLTSNVAIVSVSTDNLQVGASASKFGISFNFNSSRATGGFPQLNITYYVPPLPSMLTCNDGSYIKNQSGQLYFYSNQTGVTCQIRVLNENLTQVVGYTTMTESAKQWFNYTVNLSTVGTYWASFNCSNAFVASQKIGVVNTCDASTILIGSPQVFKKSGGVSNNMLGFVLSFGLISLFFLGLYLLMRKEHKEISNENRRRKDEGLKPNQVVNYGSIFLKYTTFGLTITSLALMFFFAWLSYPTNITDNVVLNYTNTTATSGTTTLTLPILTATSTSTTEALPAGVQSLANAALTVYGWVGIAFALIFVVLAIIRYILAMSEKAAKIDRGDYSNE